MAGTKKTRPATGQRLPVVWAVKKVKRGGKTVTITCISPIAQSTIEALKITLKPALTKGVTPKLKVAKNKSKYLPSTTGTKSGKRYLMCSIDDLSFYSVIIPTAMPYGEAAVILRAQSKAVVFKTPAGTKVILGDFPKKPVKKATKKTP